MHFDRRFAIVLAVSLGWALVVSATFYRLAGGAGGRARAAAVKQVVTATRALPAGSTVDGTAVAIRTVPESLFPPGAFTRLEDVLERPVIETIQSGEPVVGARLAAKGSGVGLGPLIPPGMRAMSVRVNDVVGVAGFVLPGMRVDVLVTGRPPNRGDTETQTVLQNIKVLSAGQTTQADAKGQPIVATVVTLLVSLQEAEALTLANNEGKIQLVLRNSTDSALVPTGGRKLHELYGGPPDATADAAPPRPHTGSAPRPAPPAAAPPAREQVPAPQPEQMIMISGSTRKVVVFSSAPEGK